MNILKRIRQAKNDFQDKRTLKVSRQLEEIKAEKIKKQEFASLIQQKNKEKALLSKAKRTIREDSILFKAGKGLKQAQKNAKKNVLDSPFASTDSTNPFDFSKGIDNPFNFGKKKKK